MTITGLKPEMHDVEGKHIYTVYSFASGTGEGRIAETCLRIAASSNPREDRCRFSKGLFRKVQAGVV